MTYVTFVYLEISWEFLSGNWQCWINCRALTHATLFYFRFQRQRFLGICTIILGVSPPKKVWETLLYASKWSYSFSSYFGNVLEICLLYVYYYLPLPFNLHLITLMEFDAECTLRCNSYLPPVDPVSSLKNFPKHPFLKHLEIPVFRLMCETKLVTYAKWQVTWSHIYFNHYMSL
jgi:hypothetical protein